MSRVHAVTEDIKFSAKVAFFTPVPADQLLKEFCAWLQERGKHHEFLVWSVNLDGYSKDFQP